MYRPSTAATSCSTATSTTAWRNEVVLGVIANKGNEVGVCACNLHTLEFTLMQYTDQPTLPVTLTLIHQLGVVEVLLPSTTLETEISKTLRRSIGDAVTFLSIPRRNFNELNGLRLIEHVANDAAVTRELNMSSRYLSVAAASAVLHYMEYLRKTALAPRSVRVAYRCIKDRVGIDRDSCRLLELVAPDLRGSRETASFEDPQAEKACAAQSLMRVVDHTLTQGGGRLLRSNILMPVGNKRTLNDRLDAVEHLVKHSDLRVSIRRLLKALQADVDHLLSKFAYSSQALQDDQFIDTTLKHVLGLRGVVQAVPGLAAALENCNAVLLRSVEKVLSGATDLDNVRDAIDAVVDTSVKQGNYRKTNAAVTKTVHVYAIRTGVDGVLDVVRGEYGATLEDIYATATKLSHDFHIASLKIVHKPSRGFLLTCDKTEMSKGGKVFIMATHGKRNALFTTKALVSLNNKLRDIYGEIMQRSAVQIKHLVGCIRSKLKSLFRASEAIALLDMLQSFAVHAATREHYVRPTFGSTLKIRAGRHPMWETATEYVPNDTAPPQHATLLVLSGANMSGKTTYLLQVALIAVMAHIGLFVPAAAAQIPLLDHIFTRLGTDDSIEQNASTFTLEMRDIAYVVGSATAKSLVVIDELGRGTGHDEGAAMAYAVAEVLAKRRCLVFFSTHYVALHNLARTQPNVANIHFAVRPDGDVLKPLYKLEEGSVSASRYGLALARQLRLPHELINDAQVLCARLAADAPSDAEQNAGWWFHTAVDRCLAACLSENVGDSDLRGVLTRLQADIAAAGYSFAALVEADLSCYAEGGGCGVLCHADDDGSEPCTQLVDDTHPEVEAAGVASVSSATFCPPGARDPDPLALLDAVGDEGFSAASVGPLERRDDTSSGNFNSVTDVLQLSSSGGAGALSRLCATDATSVALSDAGRRRKRGGVALGGLAAAGCSSADGWSREAGAPLSTPPAKRLCGGNPARAGTCTTPTTGGGSLDGFVAGYSPPATSVSQRSAASRVMLPGAPAADAWWETPKTTSPFGRVPLVSPPAALRFSDSESAGAGAKGNGPQDGGVLAGYHDILDLLPDTA